MGGENSSLPLLKVSGTKRVQGYAAPRRILRMGQPEPGRPKCKDVRHHSKFVEAVGLRHVLVWYYDSDQFTCANEMGDELIAYRLHFIKNRQEIVVL